MYPFTVVAIAPPKLCPVTRTSKSSPLLDDSLIFLSKFLYSGVLTRTYAESQKPRGTFALELSLMPLDPLSASPLV
jgi:hypothetical protein